MNATGAAGTDCVVALDQGGTAIKAALVGAQGEVLHERRVPTASREGPEAVLEQLATTVDELAASATARGLTPRAAGVVIIGIVDERAGRAVVASNLGWRDVGVRDHLAARVSLPLVVGHDVRAAALAEARLGAGRDVSDVLFVAIGTGISAGLVLDGQPYAGGGYAGEIGHVVVEPGGRRCGCGNRGCLETVASASALAQRYAERSGEAVDTVEIAARVARGEPVASAVWHEAVAALATVLAATVSLLAPQLIVLGGGLASAGEALLVPLRARLTEQLTFHRQPRLTASTLGERAGCLGAALLAWEYWQRRGHRQGQKHSGHTSRPDTATRDRATGGRP
ncbi:ROK family protein [Haloechinothrix sp. LS1_15]|uniref:ROK family protein n=1 Tax=Haloechinothrix sp. LS1_15 TaxID=2652248 RepID=UPI002945CA82|nr:ROK family protein [Haloechinothrix sp. LS1_15]MDV6012127.1 ROK family protein [Haloechinothrix sp. LS1_15]